MKPESAIFLTFESRGRSKRQSVIGFDLGTVEANSSAAISHALRMNCRIVEGREAIDPGEAMTEANKERE